MKKMFSKMLFGAAVTSAAVSPVVASAGTISGSTITTTSGSVDPFLDFANTVFGWSQGGLGIGLSIASILIGAGISVAKNSPMPVLAGIALAAFLHWGPGIAVQLLGATFL